VNRWRARLAQLAASEPEFLDNLDYLARTDEAPVIAPDQPTVPVQNVQIVQKPGNVAVRGAIVEYDSSVPREWAAGFAQLDPDRPPCDVPLKRWIRFVDDVELFLGGPFCAVAEILGWGPHDLFGCDRDWPIARIDQAGLLWLLHGDRLVALTENTATIETPTGARQTYRRLTSKSHRVLAWELSR